MRNPPNSNGQLAEQLNAVKIPNTPLPNEQKRKQARNAAQRQMPQRKPINRDLLQQQRQKQQQLFAQKAARQRKIQIENQRQLNQALKLLRNAQAARLSGNLPAPERFGLNNPARGRNMPGRT